MKTFYNEFISPTNGERRKGCKTLLRLLTLFIMCLVTGAVTAQNSVTFKGGKSGDFSSKTTTSATKNDIKVTFSSIPDVQDDHTRLAVSGTLTIESDTYKILKCEITNSDGKSDTFISSNQLGNNIKLEATLTSTGMSLKNTTSAAIRIKSIVVYYEIVSPAPTTKCTITPTAITAGVGKNFKLTANADGNPAPTYQWYSNTSASNTGGESIGGATSDTYTANQENAGTYYYYCVAKNENNENNKDNGVASEVAIVTVVKNDLTLTADNINFIIGDAAKAIVVTAKDGDTTVDGLTYSYESNNTGVATVNESGNVTPIAVGNAQITVTFAGDNIYNGLTATLNVTVTAAPVVVEPIFKVTDENDNPVNFEDENFSYDGDRLRLYLSLPENLENPTNYGIKYVLVRDGEGSGSSTPTTVYDGKYILLTSTTFITALVYNKKTGKEVGNRVTKDIRFNFTLLRAFDKKGMVLKDGDQRNLTTDDGERTYVIATFGSKDDKFDTGNTGNIVWENTTYDTGMSGSEISDFKYVARGKNDAKDENDKQFSGNTQYVPFEVKEGETAPQYYQEASTENGTFKIPVSGAYIKFEPKMGGTINVILRQNGIIADGNTGDKIDYTVMRKRHIYVCDEEGKILTNVRAFMNANSKMNTEIFGFGKENTFVDKSGDPNPQTIEQSEEYFKLYRNLVYRAGHLDCNLSEDGLTLTDASGNLISEDETKTYWTGDAKNEVTHNILYKDGNGWITLSKAYVRYSFDVKPGKTYFIMGNVTKVGVCGYSFKRLIKNDDSWAEIVNKRDITISETGTELPNSHEPDPSGISGCNVTLQRKFDKGVWTSIVLPFSVSPSTLEEAFGTGTEIIHFGKVEGSKLNLVKHYHQMIVAGTPVLIRPTNEYDGTTGTDNSKKAYPKFSNITYTGYVPIKEMTGGDWKVTGSYTPKEMPANSYYVGYKKDASGNCINNNIYLAKNARTMNGTRAWFEYIGSDPAAAKLTGLSINGVEDGETTDIDSILTEVENTNVMNGNVYNLNGQIVSRKGIDGLAKGIYVTNGKKIIVK